MTEVQVTFFVEGNETTITFDRATWKRLIAAYGIKWRVGNTYETKLGEALVVRFVNAMKRDRRSYAQQVWPYVLG